MSNINYDELMQPVIAFLGCETPQAWLDMAVENLEILMQDHANCEKHDLRLVRKRRRRGCQFLRISVSR